MFGEIFFGFLGVVGVLGLIGLWMIRRDKKKGIVSSPEEDELISDKTLENGADLNGGFVRARYMDKDGE